MRLSAFPIIGRLMRACWRAREGGGRGRDRGGGEPCGKREGLDTVPTVQSPVVTSRARRVKYPSKVSHPQWGEAPNQDQALVVA